MRNIHTAWLSYRRATYPRVVLPPLFLCPTRAKDIETLRDFFALCTKARLALLAFLVKLGKGKITSKTQERFVDIPFKTKRMLNFGDCDISGTAYFPSYLNILNGVNEEFWLHLGFPWYDIIKNERWGTPTVHISSDFSSPSFFGEELEFSVTVLKVGRSSVTIHHDISCAGEKRWSSTQVLAASDLDKHCSIPWPTAVKTALEACLQATQDHAEGSAKS